MILLQIFGWLLLLYGILGFILTLIPLRNDPETGGRKIRIPDPDSPAETRKLHLPYRTPAFFTGLAMVILLSMLVKIDGQEVAVKITPSGVQEDELKSGHWYLLFPWVKTENFDITQWVYTFADPDALKQETPHDTDRKVVKSDINDVAAPSIWVNTKDQISMKISFSVTWAIDPASADWIYTNISSSDGSDNGRYIWIEQNIIKRVATSAINDIATGYTTLEVYTTKRPEMQQAIFQRLQTELGTKHLILISVDIQKAEYNEDYAQKLLDTKLAQQEAIRMIEITKVKEEQLKQSSIDKDIAIQTAMGEAEALKIKGSSIAANPKIIQLEWINKWDGKLPATIMGDGQGVIMDLRGN